MLVFCLIFFFLNAVYSCEVIDWSEYINAPLKLRLNETDPNNIFVVSVNYGLFFMNGITKEIKSVFSTPNMRDAVFVDEDLFYTTNQSLVKRFSNGTEIICSTGEGKNLTCSENSLNYPIQIMIDPTELFFIISDYYNDRVLKYEINTFPEGYFQILYGTEEYAHGTCNNPNDTSTFYLLTQTKIYLALFDGSGKTQLVGNGTSSFKDDLNGTKASINSVFTCEARGPYLFFGDYNNHRIRRMSIIYPYSVETIAGTGNQGNLNGECSAATFTTPVGILFWNNSLLVSSFKENSIRLIDDPSIESSSPIYIPPSLNPLPSPDSASDCDNFTFISSETCYFDGDISVDNSVWKNGIFQINGNLRVDNFILSNSSLTLKNFEVGVVFLDNSVIFVSGDFQFSNSSILTLGSGTNINVAGCSYLSGTLILNIFENSEISKFFLWNTNCVVGSFSEINSTLVSCNFSTYFDQPEYGIFFEMSDCSEKNFKLKLIVATCTISVVALIGGISGFIIKKLHNENELSNEKLNRPNNFNWII